MQKNKLKNLEQVTENSYEDTLVNARKKALTKANSSDNTDFYWLNENSHKFLEAGYLTEGVTPKIRIKEIMKIF